MKFTVENPIKYWSDNGRYFHMTDIHAQYNRICVNILLADDVDGVRENLLFSKENNLISDFVYGFSGNHLWVHQLDKDGKQLENRIIIMIF